MALINAGAAKGRKAEDCPISPRHELMEMPTTNYPERAE